MNRKEKRDIVFQQAVERGGTKTPTEQRKAARRRRNQAARKARRAGRVR